MYPFNKLKSGSNKALQFGLKKIRQNSLTLVVATILLFGCIIGASKSTVFTSAAPSKKILYALSYSDSSEQCGNFLNTLESDLIFLKKNKYSFTLPKLLRNGEFGNIILIIEGSSNNLHAVCDLLRTYEAKAVFELAALSRDEANLISSLLNENVEFAGSIDGTVDQLMLSAAISEARIELMSKHAVNVSTFLRRTDKFFAPASEFKYLLTGKHPYTLFSFGDGKNALDEEQSSTFYMTRIRRLPEWTISDYFSWNS